MTTVLKADISQALGQAIIDDIFLQRNRYYYTIGKSQPWDNESEPEQVIDSEKYQKSARRDILIAKQIPGTSVSFIIPRYNYQKNVVYDKYDDAISLVDKRFYVVNSDYNVYKCLNNNISALSTVEPYGTSPSPIILDDGYTWQYIYSIHPSLRTKFLTDEYMPVFNAITERYYSRGSISSVRINSGGSGLNQETTTLIVDGDGYLEDNPVQIDNFVIGNGGSGYTSIPDVETSDQFNSYTTFSAGMNLIVGQRIKVDDVAGIRFYEAKTSGVVGTVVPTHYYTTETSGTVQLKHIGTKPLITATIDDSSVGSVIITDAGFGYSGSPIITKSTPGSGANLAPVMNGSSIESITVLAGGSGYTNNLISIPPPFPLSVAYTISTTVSLGEVLYSSVSGSVYYYRVDVAGETDTIPPTHTTGTAINGTAMLTVVGRQATAEAVLGIVDTVTQHYDVASIRILNKGSGYVQGSTTVTFSGGSPVIPAIANAIVSGGEIVAINITFPGYGYQSTPTVEIDGVGTGAIISATTQCGYGYSLPPTLIFSDPDNPLGQEPFVFSTVSKTNAKLEPIVIDGILRGIVVIDGGIGYTQATITVIGGTGASVTPIFASAELNTIQANTELLATAGTLSSITIENQGNNITSLGIDLVGDGTGAEVSPVVDNGKLIALQVTNIGQDYTFMDVILHVNVDALRPVARAIIAPINGHGSNPIKELYAKGVALNVSVGNEINNGFPITNQFRQVTILKSPLTYNNQTLLETLSASACIVVNCDVLTIPVEKNAILTSSNNTQYRIIDFTSSKLLLQNITTSNLEAGSTLNLTINNINYSIQVNSVDNPDFDKDTGDILYIDNLLQFTPSENQTINVTTTISLT